ncbi:MAG: hypothetical protein LUD07_10885 [Clostridiales bacterium]|nr:hypothetical protein [Clostridiales bacterium]
MGFGSPEEMTFIDVLTYDGSEKAVSLNNNRGWKGAFIGDRSQLELCSDGTLIIISSSSAFNVEYTFFSLTNGGFQKEKGYEQDTRERPDRSFYDGTGYLTEAKMNAILNEYTYILEDSFQWIPLVE